MLKLVLFAGLLFASSSAFAVDIGGSYDVLGKNADGTEYKGTADITLTSENTCRIEWKTGGITSSGICMRNDEFLRRRIRARRQGRPRHLQGQRRR